MSLLWLVAKIFSKNASKSFVLREDICGAREKCDTLGKLFCKYSLYNCLLNYLGWCLDYLSFNLQYLTDEELEAQRSTVTKK